MRKSVSLPADELLKMRKRLQIIDDIEDCNTDPKIEDKASFVLRHQRKVEARFWPILFSISNILYSLGALAAPISEIHFNVNLYYTISVMFCIILLCMTYKNEQKYIFLVEPVYLILIIRNGIRLFDLE